MKISNVTVGFTPALKLCVIGPKLESQFPISEKALELVKNNLDEGLIVIKHNGKLTVAHETETTKQDITLKRLNMNGKWCEATPEEIKELEVI